MNWVKWIYIIIWSFVLLVATFPSLFANEMFPIDQSKLLYGFIYPVIFAMSVFIIDIIYNTITAGKKSQTVFTWICFLVFMLFFVFTMMAETKVLQITFFAILWLSLTIAKALNTYMPRRQTWEKISEELN